MRIFACFAASLDGKISLPEHQKYVRISSDEDIAHLKRIRDTADAMLMGGATFRAWPMPHLGTTPERIATHCIVTRGANPTQDIPPDSRLFQYASPIRVLIFTENLPSPEEKSRYPQSVSWISTPGTSAQEKVNTIMTTLQAEGVRSLLIEGGGEIFGLFLEAQAVQELYLTLCPLLIGGANAPSLLSGEGFGTRPDHPPPQTKMLSLNTVGQEIYLHLSIHYPSPDSSF